jgi:hypothetical protein
MLANRALTAMAFHGKTVPVLAGFRLPNSLSPRRPNNNHGSSPTSGLTTTCALPSNQGEYSGDSAAKPIDTSLEGTYEALSARRSPTNQDESLDSAESEPRSADAPSQEIPKVLSAASGERPQGAEAGNSSSSEASNAGEKVVQEEQLQDENDNVMPASPS